MKPRHKTRTGEKKQCECGMWVHPKGMHAHKTGTAHMGGLYMQSINKPSETQKLVEELTQQYQPIPGEIAAVIDNLTKLFAAKNPQYSTLDDPFANFNESPPVSNHMMSPLLYCMTLCAKQDDALWKALKRSEGEIENLHERLQDGAVYRIIALALLKRRIGHLTHET